jgi:hypothetical protein
MITADVKTQCRQPEVFPRSQKSPQNIAWKNLWHPEYTVIEISRYNFMGEGGDEKISECIRIYYNFYIFSPFSTII